jgi:hypothetical protein
MLKKEMRVDDDDRNNALIFKQTMDSAKHIEARVGDLPNEKAKINK